MLYYTSGRKNDVQWSKEKIIYYWIKYPTSDKPLGELTVEMNMWIEGKYFIVLGFKLMTLTNTEPLSWHCFSVKLNESKYPLYFNFRLDTDKRQEALLEIVKDNKIILRRLSQCTPYYSVQEWNEQWIKTLGLMRSIGRFPPLCHSQVRYEVRLDSVLTVSDHLKISLSLHFFGRMF